MLRSIGDIGQEVIARVIERSGFVRLDIIIDAATAARANEAASRTGRPPTALIADVVKSAFPAAPGVSRE